MLGSCSKDNNEIEPLFDTSVLYGEWYSNIDGVVTDLKLSSMTLAGSVYKTEESELVLFEKWTGPWVYLTENKILNMSILHSSTQHETTHYYKIVKVDDYSLSLRDQEFGFVDSYSKIVESKKLGVGEEYDIGYLKTKLITATNYNSSTPFVASVDDNGLILAKKTGIAFISVSTNVGTIIIKIEVQ